MNYKGILASFAIALLLAGCTAVEESTTSEDAPAETVESEPLSVVASFYPLAYLTQEIAGDTLEVTNLIPAGAEPHGYEPTARQMATIESADLLVFQGAGLEPWVESQEEQLESKVKLLEVSEHLELLKTEGHEEEEHDDHEEEHDDHGHEDEHHEEHEEEHHDEHDDHEEEGHDDHDHDDDHHEEEHEDEHGHEEDHHDHNHGEYDPHTWLDPVLTIETIELIEETLTELAPEHADTFAANADALAGEFSRIHEEFESSLSDCEQDTFITSHDAFQYLAQRYNLNAKSVSGVSPHAEPSAQKLAELATYAKENNVQHIYFEVLANTKTAETLASEAGLSPLVLDPIAGLSDENQDETYVSLMEANLNNLKTGLQCQSTQ